MTALRQRGFTLLELLVSLLLVGLLMAAIGGVVTQALGSERIVAERNRLLQDGQFAMERMERMARGSRRLLLPMNDKPFTNWPENIREQTVPASPPIGDSTLASAVLAVTLPAFVDLDANGIPDADDDGDGRIDEDPGDDAQHDFVAGIALIDDDGDGSVDEGNADSDDESTTNNDDPINGVDDDNDGNIDEDPGNDVNGDNCPASATSMTTRTETLTMAPTMTMTKTASQRTTRTTRSSTT